MGEFICITFKKRIRIRSFLFRLKVISIIQLNSSNQMCYSFIRYQKFPIHNQRIKIQLYRSAIEQSHNICKFTCDKRLLFFCGFSSLTKKNLLRSQRITELVNILMRSMSHTFIVLFSVRFSKRVIVFLGF